jgi:hypothetical protein
MHLVADLLQSQGAVPILKLGELLVIRVGRRYDQVLGFCVECSLIRVVASVRQAGEMHRSVTACSGDCTN